MITSIHNERVKLVRALSQRKTRRREGRFFVEGTRLIEDALQLDTLFDFVFFTRNIAARARGQRLLRRLSDLQIKTIEVDDKVMRACCDTESPPGVLAVLPFPQLPVPAQPSLILIADALRDPGNLGTLLRSAAAADVDVVLLAPGSVDAYNPKVVRGAMGAHFRIPIIADDWDLIAGHAQDVSTWLATSDARTAYTQVDWTKPSALIIGAEAHGVSAEASILANGRLQIPMARNVESLNSGVAASVILFEAARQRAGVLRNK